MIGNGESRTKPVFVENGHKVIHLMRGSPDITNQKCTKTTPEHVTIHTVETILHHWKTTSTK